jgi:hypothetical protein
VAASHPLLVLAFAQTMCVPSPPCPTLSTLLTSFHDGTLYRGLRVRRWGLGFVHRSRTILCRAVPNPSVTIRSCFIAVGEGGCRYLALLSGGQIMRRIQRTAMGLNTTDGGAIFEFEDVPTCALPPSSPPVLRALARRGARARHPCTGPMCTSGPGGLTREVETPLPSNSPHDHMILRVDRVGSHGRWKRPCLLTAHMTI